MRDREYHPLILALMNHLPPPGGSWSADKQRRFMAALEANVRLLYDITPPVMPQRRKHMITPIEPPY